MTLLTQTVYRHVIYLRMSVGGVAGGDAGSNPARGIQFLFALVFLRLCRFIRRKDWPN
jgi:hypothetical protein